MMQPANLRYGDHPPCVHRLIRTPYRCIFAQCQMRARLLIESDETLQMLIQAPLVECDHVIEALTADRANYLLEAAGEGTILADHLSPTFRSAFHSSAIISERSSPSRVRFAAPNNGAPLTAPGHSRQRY